MLRTNTVLLRPTLEQETALFDLLEQSARLWNVANYERRQALFKKLGMPSYAAQCKRLKTNEHFIILGTGKAQALLQKLDEAWKAYRKLKQMKANHTLPSSIKKVRPPSYWKDDDGELEPRLIAVRSDCWRADAEAQIISISRRLKIPYASGDLWVGKRGRLEIQYDKISNRWYAHVPVNLETQPITNKTKAAAIDIGICNLIALAIEGHSQQIIWNGGAVLADWQYWTKRISKYESQLKRDNGKDGSLGLSRLYRARTRRKTHAINAMLRQLFEILEENGVGLLKFGDLTGIREDANHGDSGNQKLHNFWVFAQMQKRIIELAEEYGIRYEKVDERNSSKTCVFHPDEQKGRIHRGLYRCREFGIEYNADAGGATNLLYGNGSGKVATTGTQHGNVRPTSGSGALARPLFKRWDYHVWS